jgi:hypothetical protein
LANTIILSLSLYIGTEYHYLRISFHFSSFKPNDGKQVFFFFLPRQKTRANKKRDMGLEKQKSTIKSLELRSRHQQMSLLLFSIQFLQEHNLSRLYSITSGFCFLLRFDCFWTA